MKNKNIIPDGIHPADGVRVPVSYEFPRSNRNLDCTEAVRSAGAGKTQ
jgi:hypothetical protein